MFLDFPIWDLYNFFEKLGLKGFVLNLHRH
jgi:hypothetical protein